MLSRACLPLLCLALASCAGPSRAAVGRVWLPAYAFGVLGGGDLDVRDVCASGAVDKLELGTSWATLGVALVTLGVYTPREARFRCVASR